MARPTVVCRISLVEAKADLQGSASVFVTAPTTTVRDSLALVFHVRCAGRKQNLVARFELNVNEAVRLLKLLGVLEQSYAHRKRIERSTFVPRWTIYGTGNILGVIV